MTPTKTHDGLRYREAQQWPINKYYGPTFTTNLDPFIIFNEGDSFEFKAIVVGYPLEEFTYQWFKNGSPASVGGQIISITTSISGSSFIFSSSTAEDSGTEFSLNVTNPYNGSASTTSSIFLPIPDALFTVAGSIQ